MSFRRVSFRRVGAFAKRWGGPARGLLAAALVFAGCAGAPRSSPPGTRAAALELATSPASSAPPAVSSAPVEAPTEPLLVVTDPTVVSALETLGLAFGDLVSGAGIGAVSNRELGRTARYAKLVEVLSADVASLGRGDALAGVGVGRFSHRLFDVRWLSAASARFELVAVVHRADRAVFRPGSCGEARLVYRLAYRVEKRGNVTSSRLPMTLAFELPLLGGPAACETWNQRFSPPRGLSGMDLARWLVRPGGPLERGEIERSLSRHRLASNVQGVRWPSAVRPDLGGHAEYLLRSFELDVTGAYVAAPLENTPDRERLARDATLRSALVAWLSDGATLAAIDRGTAVMPERFLARRAVSVTPRGLTRLANRPFASLVTERELSALDFSGLATVRSVSGLIRRLDALSCPGCHAARSVAGFHLLGEDSTGTLAGNALSFGVSPHVHADLPRRLAFSKALATGQVPDAAQPFPERGAYDGYGAHCGLGTDPSFVGWTCRAGYTCRALDAPAGDDVGLCLPEGDGFAGDPCEMGPLTARLDPRRDRVASVTRRACAAGAVCNTNAVGFPGGMCTESCAGLSAAASCGQIAVLDPFNACLARGEPFGTCIAIHARPAGLRACSADAPCRDDYVCAGTGSDAACIPPYFLFQLRVDGH